MTPAAYTLLVFALAVGLFVSDVLPIGLVVFSVPFALYFGGVITAQEIFPPMVGPTGMSAKIGGNLSVISSLAEDQLASDPFLFL